MSRRRRVVLVPAPFQGHITPMLQLGSILESSGFSIVVAHSEYNAPDPLNHSGFMFLPLPDNVADCDKTFMNMMNVLDTININCKLPFQDYLAQLMENVEVDGEVVCIVFDTIMTFVNDVANSLQLPTIVMRPFSSAYSRAHEYLMDLRSENCLPLPECQMGETVPNFHPFKFKDMPLLLTNEIPDRLFEFLKKSHDIGSSCAIIWNTMDEIEHHHLSLVQKDFQVPIFSIGPFHKMAPTSKTSLIEEDNNCIEWLDKQAPNSVLYVSLGSITSMDEKELMETAWGLIGSEQPFLWVIRDKSVNGAKFNSQLPDGFDEIIGNRGCIVKWAPQKKVLQHSAVGGFWSHCGWNSTLESISEGVPMICRPDFSDQRINTRYVTDVWNVGWEMEGPVDRESVEKIVTKLMVDVEGKDMRKKAVDMKHKFQDSMKEGGSSFLCLNELTEFISTLSGL
ncbi:transferase [Lithospermum erythrorhizon]|uniref:Transferase n=1 Tax=Lithospermum erythrorhizon TaxID=34254 RepID=A0AAV3RC08_LITER